MRRRWNNFTTGQVYESVIKKEREGDYLGGGSHGNTDALGRARFDFANIRDSEGHAGAQSLALHLRLGVFVLMRYTNVLTNQN